MYHVSLVSFNLWCKENLVKHEKVSEYYDHDCRLGLDTGTGVFFSAPYVSY